MGILGKLIGTKNDRDLKKLAPNVQAVGQMEAQLKDWSDDKIASRIAELKAQTERALKGEGKGQAFEDIDKEIVTRVLDDALVETFAIVREAGMRVLGMRHYDCQLVGGMVLHSGRIAEMKTGEGKTLVATLPCVLNALTGQGVHVVTVNDYLASRDAEWMGRIYRFLGLSVGVVYSRQPGAEKKRAYNSDITYGQNNEFGFDYLRDNMKFSLKDYKQRGHAFAVVDEVDSILIDEARTPLIISGPAEDNTPLYVKANGIVPQLRKDEHYTIDEKSRSVLLTEAGVERCEQLLRIDNLYDPVNIEILHHISQALKAHAIYKRDAEYVVDGGEVVIVDEHTGRLMPGRRWSDGLHGAIEAKENVKIQNETQTLATVSFQNYFRMYKKLSGMTGTADTEAEEFAKIYELDVLVIPTNRPIARDDEDDLIFKTEPEKVDAIVDDIVENNENGVPILVGTVSVEKSEVLSRELKKRKIKHEILNAKRHRDEAAIVSQAGRPGSVTIATNMAGRGTDILLGGDPEFMARTDVAEHMHTGGGEAQLADYAFLSGRPDLIFIDKLAERDKKSGRFIAEWEEKIEKLKEEAEEEGKTFELPEDFPKTVEEARERIYEDRIQFYEEAVKLYTQRLEVHGKICSAEKEKVKDAGGLRIIGTERHESRRIDNQLRGRAGRQGDPGSSRFYLSLQDDLMRIFAAEKMIRVMEALGMEDGVPIEHKMVTKSIANAQKRVEGMHFDSRKNLLEYDDVMNSQRKATYALRRQVLEADPSREVQEDEDPVSPELMRELMFDIVEEFIVQTTMIHCPEKTSPTEWKVDQIQKTIFDLLGVSVDLAVARTDRDDIMDKAFAEVERVFKAKAEEMSEEIMGQLSAFLYLQTIDARWKEHLQHMDHLREGIHMRAYGQRDPKQEYKKEGFRMYQAMRATVRDEVLEKVFKAEVSTEQSESAEELARMRRERRRRSQQQSKRQSAGRAASPAAPGGGGAGGGVAAPPMPGGGSFTGTPLKGVPMPRSRDSGPTNRAQRRREKAKGRKRAKLR